MTDDAKPDHQEAWRAAQSGYPMDQDDMDNLCRAYLASQERADRLEVERDEARAECDRLAAEAIEAKGLAVSVGRKRDEAIARAEKAESRVRELENRMTGHIGEN